MKKIISDKLPRILKNKKKLEKLLNIKITNRGKEVYIEGEATDEYISEKVIDAINFGFPLSHALEIKEQDYMFEILNIKNYSKSKNLGTVRSRIIGTQGKTLQTLHDLTKCYFELKDNEVGIIGNPEYIENAQNAVISIIKGSKQSNVYSFLEKHQVQEIGDLGLKE